MSDLKVGLLGRFQAVLGGRDLRAFRTRKVQALLIHLLVEAVQGVNKGLERERVMTMLWPEMPRKAAQENLRQSLYQLRRIIPDVSGPQGHPVPLILSDRKAIRVNPEAHYELDVAEFTKLVRRGNIVGITTAVEIYRGDFLADFYLKDSSEFEAWASTWRARLRREMLDVLDWLAEHMLMNGRPREAAEYARRALEMDRLRESAYRSMMIALDRLGKRPDALRQYETLRTLLAEELGTMPSAETEGVAAAVRRGAQIGPGPGRLPVPETPIVGRHKELADVTALFDGGSRLVTIVGPGGIGKTRLALEVARGLGSYEKESPSSGHTHFERVAFVDLSRLSAVEEVVPAAARAIGLELERGDRSWLRQRLLNSLRDKQLLLVLDNFEHLIQAADLVKDILAAAQEVQMMVTSRERLRLQGEQVYPLWGLEYSEWDHPVQAARDPAVELFLQQARRVRPAFSLRSEHMESLRAILEMTEGMPLALILAASWIKVMSPADISAGLAQSLDLLEATERDIPDRQRNIRAVFGTTWDRLDEVEQALFSQVSIFRGGFTLDGARAVTGARPADLGRLVDHSLILRTEGGRFEIHELLRQFAAEHLQNSGEVAAVREAHSIYYLTELADRLPDLRSRRQLEALDAIEKDFENIRLAWRRACETGEWKRIKTSSESLHLFARIRSRFLEGAALFESAHRLMRMAENSPSPTEHAFVAGCWMGLLDSAGLVESALAIAAEMEGQLEAVVEPHARAVYRLHLGETFYDAGRFEDAFEIFDRAREYFEQEGDPFYAATNLMLLGWSAQALGQPEEASRWIRRGLSFARKAGDYYLTAAILMSCGGIMRILEGPSPEVEEYFREAADLRRQIGARVQYAANLAELANIYVNLDGSLQRARPLLEEALAISEEQGVPYLRAKALAELSTHRLIEENYDQVLELTEEVLNIAYGYGLTWTRANFQRAAALLALGKPEEALPHARVAFSRMIEKNWTGHLWILLPFLGMIISERGDHERAVELLACSLTQPHASGRLEADPLVSCLHAELSEKLSDKLFESAWERGIALDVREAVTEGFAMLEEPME